MMGIARANEIDMTGQSCIHDQRAPKLLDETGGKIEADHRLRHCRFEVQKGTPRNIDDDASKRFVKRSIGMTIAGDASFIVQRLANTKAERDADVLNRVMRIHRRVSRA